MMNSRFSSLDHLVGERQQVRRYFEPECLCSLEINHELELSRLHGGKVGRLDALENPPGIDAGLAKSIGQAGSVARQAAEQDVLARPIERRHHVLRSQRDNLSTPAV